MIFCLDNDKNSRELIGYGVGNCGMAFCGFHHSDAFFHALSDSAPHIILLDIELDHEDGFHVLQRLKRDPHTADIPVIIISAKAEEYDKILALDSGADDFVSKPFGVLELISRIRAVLRRSYSDVNNVIRINDIMLDRTSHRVYAGGEEIFLTNREYQLFEYLLENEGVLLTREQLLRQVWGFDFQAETRTVDVHIRYLRQKLGKSGAMIETVRGVGYRMGGSNEK